jgi:membrane protein required for colicin V production
MVSWPINTFGAAIYIFLFLAVVMGFMTGLLRSLATIFGYVAAMGIVVALAPQLARLLSAQFRLSPAQTWIALGVIFVVAGIALGARLRVFVNEMVGGPMSAFPIASPAGLRSLPPEVEAYIDRLKKQQRL